MGIFTAPAPAQLVPANPPIAVFKNYVAQRPTTLVLKEKVWSLSGDSFSVKDAATGQPVVKVAGKVLSLRDRKRESGCWLPRLHLQSTPPPPQLHPNSTSPHHTSPPNPPSTPPPGPSFTTNIQRSWTRTGTPCTAFAAR